MPACTRVALNRRIRKEIDARCEWERGEGYHYFIWDDPTGGIWDTQSIPVCYFNGQSPERWMADAADFRDLMIRDHYQSED